MIVVVALCALTARADQKNVQILKGMTDVQLQRTMNLIRSSLGVHCDYCHVVDEEHGWNFAADDKPQKKRAREMVAMVMKINHETFADNPTVSCNTCHRGSARPLRTVTLPQPAPPFPTPKPETPQLPALADVIKKYAAAIGDESRLALPRTLRGTRENFDNKPVTFTMEQSGGQFHTVIQSEKERLEQTLTRSGGWSRDPKGAVAPLRPGMIENQREVLAAFEPMPPSAIPADARVTSLDKIDGKDVVVVTNRINDAQRQRLFFDAASGLMLRRIVLTQTAIGEIPRQTDFDDWRDAGGTKFPFTVRVSLVDPWAGSLRHYTDVRLGASVDESAFQQPPPSP